ncbi:hypothetical protein SCLCIDRAFT_732373 [Scleroderma citrinum Foug A]|uniref:Uncharacterized protein n=1 Tax=Scleroderma citrinum Foug A TaxID=1036808 RepID=A0A0C3E6L2_9AGAM|nr:hypothetical protein SCLCIDRAFT_732373 [Scleroderma citrinum Foug A]
MFRIYVKLLDEEPIYTLKPHLALKTVGVGSDFQKEVTTCSQGKKSNTKAMQEPGDPESARNAGGCLLVSRISILIFDEYQIANFGTIDLLHRYVPYTGLLLRPNLLTVYKVTDALEKKGWSKCVYLNQKKRR